MMPPTSIDGTDITGATIDGTDVTEITVDGDTVFSAQTLPVRFSDMVGWWPMDAASYGISSPTTADQAKDMTAVIGGSADDTAYDCTVFGATYQSTGDITDINAGANSGYFEFDGSNDKLDNIAILTTGITELTTCAWAKSDSTSGNNPVVGQIEFGGIVDPEYQVQLRDGDDYQTQMVDNSGNRIRHNEPVNVNTYYHLALVFDNGTMRTFLDGNQVFSSSGLDSSINFSNTFNIGHADIQFNNLQFFFDGEIDDARLYNAALSQNDIEQIYDNTKPPSKP